MVARIQDVAALIGRLGIALVFFVHGLDKWNAGIPATADALASFGIPLPTLSAVFIIAVEVLGSIAFAAGFALPLVAAGYAVVGLGGLFFVHLDAGLTGQGGYEYVLVLAATALAIGLNGGRLSLDHLLLRRWRGARELQPA